MLGKIRQKMKNKKGFTMVELIVVIVIILVLAAALVPQLLKYVDTANRANCQSEAATLLAQVQADWTASQASDKTGVNILAAGFTYKVQDVTITKSDSAVKHTDLSEAHTAKYYVSTSTVATDATEEITSFGYTDGKYTSVWTSEKGWVIAKKGVDPDAGSGGQGGGNN